jgi:tRNA pseudouridine38-40 synthase
MVRTLAGTLLEIGFGKMTEKDLAQIIEKKDRSGCGRTLLAKGLRLVKVEYDI